MSKKKRAILIISAIVLVAVVALCAFASGVKVSKNATAELYYENDYEGIYITTALSQEETEIIRQMINPARVAEDDESIEFSDKVYLSFVEGKRTKDFYIALDASAKLRYKDKIVELKDWEIDQLHSILGGYGAVFPCV